MQIYIGNLSHEISSHDLMRLFRGFEDHTSFEFKYYMRGEKRFYFALTSIEPESVAIKAIKRCHMKRIKGRLIVIRDYKGRALVNERRSLDWREKLWDSDERRATERRNIQHDKNVNDIAEYQGPVPAHSYYW
jgi:hypothetical protein